MLVQQLINGLIIGGAYALFAVSFTVLFGVLDIVNLAQASILTLGAFTAFWVMTSIGGNLIVAALLAFIVGGIAAVLMNLIVFKPLRGARGRSPISALVASLGLLFLMNGVLQIASDTSIERIPTTAVVDSLVTFGPISIPTFHLIMLGAALCITAALTAFFRFSRSGHALRAVGWNPSVSRALGIPAERWINRAFLIAGGLAALSGVIVGVAYNYVFYRMGNPYLLKGLAAIIVGGLGSINGAVIGGLLIGITESLSIAYLSASWRDAVTFGLLMLILVLRPQGIMGRQAKVA